MGDADKNNSGDFKLMKKNMYNVFSYMVLIFVPFRYGLSNYHGKT